MPIWLPQGALSGPYKERRASVLTARARQSLPLSQDTCFRVTIKGKEPRRASPRSSRSGQKPPCSRPSPPRNHVDQSFLSFAMRDLNRAFSNTELLVFALK